LEVGGPDWSDVSRSFLIAHFVIAGSDPLSLTPAGHGCALLLDKPGRQEAAGSRRDHHFIGSAFIRSIAKDSATKIQSFGVRSRYRPRNSARTAA
jgi:hypothetical protein